MLWSLSSEEIMSRSIKRNPYTHTPFMSKSVVPSYGVRPPMMKKVKEYQDFGEYFCINCKDKIENVRYSCLDCINYDLCKACEEKVEHQHPLLKSRLSKEPRPSDNSINDANENSQVHFSRDHGRAMTMTTSVMFANKAQSNGIYISDESTYDNSNRNFNSGASPAKSSFNSNLRYSNSMAYINLPERAGSESLNFKNPSQFSHNSANKSPHSANMPLGINYNKGFSTPKGETPFEKEAKKYKAVIVKPPLYDLINVKPDCIYKVEFTIKNAGTEKWPEDVKLLCINGVHKRTEEGLPALNVGQKHEVKLALRAPKETGRFLSQWRLQYNEEGGTPKPFGSNLFVEINVAEGTKKGTPLDYILEEKPADKEEGDKKETREVARKIEPVEEPKMSRSEVKERVKPEALETIKEVKTEVREVVKPDADEGKKHKEVKKEEAVKSGLTEEERQIMQETKCSELVLRQAQKLHDIYRGEDIRKQIDFVEECPIHLDINEIVMLYCSRMESNAMNL